MSKYSSARPPRPRAALLLVVLLAVSCGEARAASPVSLEALVGLGGVARAGRWAPVIVTVDNRGPARRVTVSVEVFRGSDLRGTLASRTFSRTVELAARSRRRLPFVVPVASVPQPAVLRATSAGDGEPNELARREVDLRPTVVNDRIVVAVSSELAFDFLAAEGARVVYPHAENLPEAWAGWSGADLVVVRDTAFHRLTAAQATALERWVRAGGTVVFTGGGPALQLAASGLAGLLPVEPTGLVERAGLASLGRLAGVAPPSRPATLASARLREGTEALAADGDCPIVAVRRTGAGSAVWLAFDPADRLFAAWLGLAPLWRAVAGDATAVAPLDESLREPLDDPWIAPLAASAGVSFPSHALLLIFLAAFVLPSLALLLVPWRLDARVRAALLLLIAAAASTAGWFVFDRRLFRDDFLLEAALVEAGDGHARLSRRLAVCSPSGGPFELALGAADYRLEDVSAVSRGRSPMSLAVAVGGATTADGTTTASGAVAERFSGRLLVADSVIPFALSAALETDGAGTRLVVDNRTGAVIRDAFLAVDRGVLRLGDVASGAPAVFMVTADGEAGGRERSVLIVDAVRRAYWERQPAAIDGSRPVLVGWLDEPPLAARLGGAPAAVTVCMVTLEVGGP